jgi:hypothetical protein
VTARRLSFLLVFLLAGCPAARTPPTLIGKSEAEVVALMGSPDERSQWVLPQPGFGPKPDGLAQGTAFTNLHYRDHGGQQWHVMLVSPQVFKEARGVNPGPEPLYVIQVATFPKDAVF